MFVRNPSGTVHSVPDDFVLPGDEKNDHEGWSVVTEADASPELLGQPDPAVTAVELHDGSDNPVIDESGPASEPGDIPTQDTNDIQADADPNLDVQPVADPEQVTE